MGNIIKFYIFSYLNQNISRISMKATLLPLILAGIFILAGCGKKDAIVKVPNPRPVRY